MTLMKTRVPACTLFLLLSLGCTKHNEAHNRLNGTWKSNRDATVALAFEKDPRWTNATPEKVERFKNIFGNMTITYSNGIAFSKFQGTESTFNYKFAEIGSNYLVIHVKGGLMGDQDSKLTFAEGGRSYWVNSKSPIGSHISERFDRVENSR